MLADALGDRMKSYEAMEARRSALPGLPIVLRLDGKRFSAWTQGLARPFDERLSSLMIDVTQRLVEETGARCGYTQSDEITLVLMYEQGQQPWLGARWQKLTSLTASMATAWFNAMAAARIPERADRPALFDSRAWVVPSPVEATNAILWREVDATKNSISMAARALFSHKELHGRSGSEMQDMLHARGVNWNDYPAFFKRGTVVGRTHMRRVLTAEELEDLPPLHAARRNPDLVVERTAVVPLDLPPLRSVVNRVGVLLEGEAPVLAGKEAVPTEATSAS